MSSGNESVRRNIVQPRDWWAAFDAAAAADGLYISEWLGEAGKAKLAKKDKEKARALSVRVSQGRPKVVAEEEPGEE